MAWRGTRGPAVVASFPPMPNYIRYRRRVYPVVRWIGLFKDRPVIRFGDEELQPWGWSYV
jgi:hypothetical protein